MRARFCECLSNPVGRAYSFPKISGLYRFVLSQFILDSHALVSFSNSICSTKVTFRCSKAKRLTLTFDYLFKICLVKSKSFSFTHYYTYDKHFFIDSDSIYKCPGLQAHSVILPSTDTTDGFVHLAHNRV